METGPVTECYRFEVRGRVQGVGFRQATARRARQLGLRGWVRNRDDGAVEGRVLSMDARALAEFHRWLAGGPPTAIVTAVTWLRGDPEEAAAEAGFEVRR